MMTPAKRRALGLREEVGSMWNPSTPDDVRAEQKRADSARAALSTAIASKPPTGGDPVAIDNTVRGWNALDAQVRAYMLEEPSILWWTRDEQVKRGQAFETQIESFRQQFERLGAAVPPAPPPPPPPTGLFDTPLLSDVSSIVKWGAIAFLAYELLGKR